MLQVAGYWELQVTGYRELQVARCAHLKPVILKQSAALIIH